MKPVLLILIVLLLGSCRLHGQTDTVKPAPMASDADPAFDVATIKPSDPAAGGRALNLGGRTFSAKNFTLDELAVFGYSIQAKQLIGGSGWMETQGFDVTGVPDLEGQPSNGQWRSMIRKLLASRFQLVSHHEQRELDVYRLGVAKSGPKMARNESGKPGPGQFNIRIAREGIVLTCRNESIPELVQTMALTTVDRPVLDATGLAGRFDFSITFAPDGAQFGGMHLPPPAEGSTAPSLFTAMQDEIGLKLEAVKAPVDTVVIDRAEKVSAN